MEASDALYGFVAWLTSREGEVVMGSEKNACPAMEALKQFMAANDIGDPSPEYPDSFVMPVSSSPT